MPGIGPLGGEIPSGSPDHALRTLSRCVEGRKNLIRPSIFALNNLQKSLWFFETLLPLSDLFIQLIRFKRGREEDLDGTIET